MEFAPTQPVERSWFLQSVAELAQFARALARNFVRTLLVSEGFAVLLAVVVYFSTRGGPAWRAPLAFLFVLAAAGVIAFAISVQIAALLSLADTVREKGLAKKTLDALFSELLGVTAQKPEGDLELTRSLHGVPVEQLRARLRRAGESMLENRVALALPRFVQWLVRKAQALLVWATVLVVAAYATAKSDADRKVDLLALRASLTEVVDDLVTKRISEGAIRFALLLAIALCLGAWALVWALLRFTN
jgi:hypothetical protein